jgi:cyclohexanecarboxyl-CoA dehydrogenase
VVAEGYLTRAMGTTFPWEIHQQVADLGVLGLLAGPAHSPLETDDFVAAGLAVEELAFADFNVANAVIPVLLMSSLLASHAQPAVRERWLQPLVEGREYAAFGLTEPHTGSDATALRTTAVVTADGYVISGEKTSVTMLANSSSMIVTARTIRDGVDVGASCFLVDLDAPGLTRSDIPDTGWQPMGRGVLHLDRVEVESDALIGPEGSAFRSVLGGFDFTRPLLALTGIGCARSAIDLTATYVRDREAFGSPLARFEGVSFPLAEHATTLEAARLVCYNALWLRNQGLRHTAEAAMARWYGPLMASQAVKDCLLLHGNTDTPASTVSSNDSGTSWPSRSPTAPPRSRRSSLPANSSGGNSSPTGSSDAGSTVGGRTQLWEVMVAITMTRPTLSTPVTRSS